MSFGSEARASWTAEHKRDDSPPLPAVNAAAKGHSDPMVTEEIVGAQLPHEQTKARAM